MLTIGRDQGGQRRRNATGSDTRGSGDAGGDDRGAFAIRCGMAKARTRRSRPTLEQPEGREGPHPRARALYSFIRAIVGDRLSDNEIARRWRVDGRVFNDIKHGRVAVPRIERLRLLASILGVNEHFIYAVAAGAPWRRIVAAVRRGGVERALEVLAGSASKAEEDLGQTRAALESGRARLAEVSSEFDLRDAQLRTLLDQLWVGVLSIDVNGQVIGANPIVRQLFGLSKTSGPLARGLTGTTFIDLDGERIDAHDLPICAALRTGRAVNRTFAIHRKGHAPHVVVATASPIRNSQGSMLGVISVLREVSALLAGARLEAPPSKTRAPQRTGKRERE